MNSVVDAGVIVGVCVVVVIVGCGVVDCVDGVVVVFVVVVWYCRCRCCGCCYC